MPNWNTIELLAVKNLIVWKACGYKMYHLTHAVAPMTPHVVYAFVKSLWNNSLAFSRSIFLNNHARLFQIIATCTSRRLWVDRHIIPPLRSPFFITQQAGISRDRFCYFCFVTNLHVYKSMIASYMNRYQARG